MTRRFPQHCTAFLLGAALLAGASTAARPVRPTRAGRYIRAEMGFLASDALHGRGSGTRDEWIAARYVASQLEEFGVKPAGDHGDYLQTGEVQPKHRTPEKGFEPVQREHTWNVLGVLPGSDPALAKQVVLLSAHLDHIGVGPAVHGDTIYNGADDDASGTVAVLEMARRLAAGPRPKRTVLFAVFGTEELGGDGDRWFLDHPPVPLDSIVANLEFEMIGRPDPKIKPDQLWLTGFDRSDLGATLDAHGAPLVNDPRPQEKFFTRSDNYALARRGIVAHTVSSFGLHPDYHKPSDDLSRIDFKHMAAAIESMVPSVEWLANTDWKPSWTPAGDPHGDKASGGIAGRS